MRDRLRAATAVEHEALHRAGPFARIMRGDINRAGYADLLETLYRFHAALAPLCAGACVALYAADLGAQGERRLAGLRRDMSRFGVQPSLSPRPVVTCSEGFAIGCLYAVLGSTLGGKLIYGRLDGFLPGVAGREFFLGSSDDGALWRSFCHRLEAFADEQRATDIVAGARYAFDLFRDCLEGGR